MYIHEIDIIKVKVRDQLTFPKSRKRVESQKTGIYAQAVAQQSVSECLTLFKQKDKITELMETVTKN